MEEKKLDPDTKLYKKRWWMLTMFMGFCTLNSFQWAQYPVVEDVIVDYYNIKTTWVEWTSMSYAMNLGLFVIPWVWLLQRWGFRKSILLASWFNTIGAVIKLFSSSRDAFPIAFAGQWLVAVGQLGYLPSRLAAIWFGEDEISTACSFGVVGNQIGVAFGFVIPPLIIKMNDDKEVTRSQIQSVNYMVATSCIIVHILMFVCMKEEPKLPPSKAALEQKKVEVNFFMTLRRLVTNKGYLLLSVVYGINMGIFCAFATLLNRMVLTYFPDAGAHIGWIGLTLIISGGIGTVVAGFLLDKYGHFKEFSVIFNLMATIALLATSLVIDKGHIFLIYLVASSIGFFMTAYFTIGFEYGAELAYPENEGTSLGILNGIPQSAAIGTTLLGSEIIQMKGVIWCLCAFSFAMIIATVIASIMPKDYKRRALKNNQQAQKQTNGAVTQQEMKPLQPDENHV